MKLWPLIGSTAGRCGVPGDLYLLNDGWRRHVNPGRPQALWMHRAAALRSVGVYSLQPVSRMAARVPTPVAAVVIATPECTRARKRSDGGS